MKLSLVLVSVIIVVFTHDAEAQWSVISNIPSPNTAYGVVTYRDGVLWAGSADIYKSTDLGQTWTMVLPLSRHVFGIDFYDRTHGAIATDDGVYLTSDGGTTWTRTQNIQATVISVRFGARVDDLYAGSEANTLWVSNDAGATWARQAANFSWTQDFATPSDKSTLAFESAPPKSGWLFRTTDRGATWSQLAGVTDGDCWSIATSTCDSEVFYIVNEENGGSGQSSRFWVSTDHGASWKATLTLISQDMLGAIATYANCVYVPTKTKGVMRSTDYGTTWATISGPTVTFDSRRITALSANELFVYGETGDVYHTTNSGGSPVSQLADGGSFDLIPSSLTFPDSVPCFSTQEIPVHVERSCSTLAIKSYRIAGQDASYFIGRNGATADTIVVAFSPDGGRQYASTLHVVLSNDSVIDIPLKGYGKSTGVVTLGSGNVSNDTIGGDIEFPIILHKNVIAESLDFGVRYDSSELEYAGTYSKSGNEVSVKGSSLKVHFDSLDANVQDSIIGYVRFQIFPITTGCTTVTFDSITFNSLCSPSRPPDAVAQACATANCANPVLTPWLRYDRLRYWIVPNPASGTAMVASTSSLANVRISIFDALGHECPFAQNNEPSASTKLNVSELSAGIYTVLIRSEKEQIPLKLLILR